MELTRHIGRTVRRLRRARAWTQTDLARRLGLSQSRLSELENGGGSFSAEQLLTLLKLFNVSPQDFDLGAADSEAQLQNALARFGAGHLREHAEVLPDPALGDLGTTFREALASGNPRMLTALAPVLVESGARLNLGSLYLDLSRVGLERRLAWTAENTAAAIGYELAAEPPSAWARRARRQLVLLQAFLDHTATESDRAKSLPLDVVDPSIRSSKSLEDVRRGSSGISQRWHIVSALTPTDFREALRSARVERR